MRAVNGIPFAIERTTELVQKDRLLDLNTVKVHENTLDEFVKLAHSALSIEARMTIQARAVFDDPVPSAALKYVLEPQLAPSEVESATQELGRGNFLFRIGSGDLLGIHEFDHESSYRSIEHDGILDRKQLHQRAADYFAHNCKERDHWYEWTSYDELSNDIKRFNQLIRAGETVAAANALSISKVEFLNWTGHVDRIRRMCTDLDVGEEHTHALLVKHFAIADSLVVVGPFEKAITELNNVLALARSMGDAQAEISALYELGLAYRYTGHGDKAVETIHAATKRLQEIGDSEWLAYCLYGYSLACTYAGKYFAAIQAGIEQVQHGRRTGESYFVSRGNSSLCIPNYVVGRMPEAARCAKESAAEFVNTAHEYMVGFIENVYGLALIAQGEVNDAEAAFARARNIGKRTAQRRVEGLVATNLAWVLYDQGDLESAMFHAREAISIFEDVSEPDSRLANHLREAFDCAREGDRKQESRALWNFLRSDYVNPDLVRRVTVAEHILLYRRWIEPEIRQGVESFLDDTRKHFSEIIAELEEGQLES